MPLYRRSRTSGGTYFFTVTLEDRSSRLLVDQMDALRAAYGAVARLHPFETVAICILPDHVHAVWRLPEADSDYSSRWQQIKRRFSSLVQADARRSRSLRSKREKGLWQRRFWEHQIRDDEDLARHVDYIHINPVKHGHVQAVAEWPYSSFHRWVRDGHLPASWGLVSAPGGSFGE